MGQKTVDGGLVRGTAQGQPIEAFDILTRHRIGLILLNLVLHRLTPCSHEAPRLASAWLQREPPSATSRMDHAGWRGGPACRPRASLD